MKQRIYLRVAKTNKTPKVSASLKPNFTPIDNGRYMKKHYPTVLIGLDIDIPDSEFESTRILLDAKIKETTPCVEIKQIESGEIKNENKSE